MTVVVRDDRWCRYCGPQVWHSGVCPRVKEIEYHDDGTTVKRVKLWRVDEWAAAVVDAKKIAQAAANVVVDALKKASDGSEKGPEKGPGSR